MPRTGGGTGPFVLNPVYLAVPGTTILATQHNTPLEDIEDTFNIPQPIAYGGTQAASAIEAMDNLFIVGADKASSASIDLDNVTGSFVNITGTIPVTSIALAEGAIRFARAVSALPLTASASLIVNGSTTQSYTCEAGDQMMIIGYAAAVVRIWVTGRNKFIGSQFNITDETDQTKIVRISAAGLPTGTVRQLDAPYYSGTLGLVSDIRGQIYGLTLSNNVTNPTTHLDIAAGSAVDSTGTVSMLLASGLTKNLTAAWAVGNNQGMLATGVAVANTTYHIFEIQRTDTKVVDIAADTSITGANIPANTNAAYTINRRIGSIVRSGGAILAFTQRQNFFKWVTGTQDVNAVVSSGTSAVTRTLTVPLGIVVGADIILQCISPAGTNMYCRVSELTQSDVAPTNGTAQVSQGSQAQQQFQSWQGVIYTNTSGQIRSRQSSGGASDSLYIRTEGWIDINL